MEGEVRAPGLVDDERHAAPVRDLGQPGDVRHGAEVGRRHDRRPDGPGRLVERPLERLRGHAVGDVELRVELGRHEGRTQPGHDQRVDRARVGVALRHDLGAAMGERQKGRVVSLRRAVDEPPGAARTPGLGGEPLGLDERGRLLADVDAPGERGDVERERLRADRLGEARVRARAALVAGHVQAAGHARGIGAQRVEVGGVGLARGHERAESR